MLGSVLSVTRTTTTRSTPFTTSIRQWINGASLNMNNNNGFQVPSWLGPILWAAPKKKTSHSKKRMRASNKALQQKENITACPACGNTKLLHHLCKHCYGDIKQKAKHLQVSA
ncbi:unnamed protein product [Cunninghamella blakesleeana]